MIWWTILTKVSSWSTQPFGRNRYGPKIGWGLCPFGEGGAGSPSNTMWPGPRPTCVPSFILIRQTVWPQYTNVTDRQTDMIGQDRQQSYSIERTDLQTVAQKLQASVCWAQPKYTRHNDRRQFMHEACITRVHQPTPRRRAVSPIGAVVHVNSTPLNIIMPVFSERELTFTFAICYRPSVCRLSVVCNVRALYSGGWNFRQYFYGVRYLGHPLTSTENFTENVPGEPLRRGRWTHEG